MPAALQFAVIGDYGAAGLAENNVANLVKSWSPDLIVTTGDNNYDTGSAATIDANIGQYYHDFIYPYEPPLGNYGSGSPTNANRFYPVLGNHDWQTRSGSPALPTPYLDYFTLPGNERYYTFTAGPVQFFAVDSDPNEPDGNTAMSIQGQWLRQSLQASAAPWKIVYLHHSPYSSGAEHGSESTMQWPFKDWGASAVLSGHDHDYERLNVDGMPYFVNGLGGKSIYSFGAPVAGSQLRYNGNDGAMHVTATENRIQFQFITSTGTLIDSYTIDLATPLPTVSITASDPSASEAGSNTGSFTVTRTGSTGEPLTVSYSIGGTAGNGLDYTAIANSVTIPAGASSAVIVVTPRDDTENDANETVVLKLAPSESYNTDAANRAKLTITDNDSSIKVLVPAGAVWKYRDNGSNQGTAWRTLSFDDSRWKSGPAELGYGDGDENTTVRYGPDPNHKYITTYFRRAFQVSNAAAITALKLRLLKDDGAIVYLNGRQIMRSNMPSGMINYQTLASTALGAPLEAQFVEVSIAPSQLATGTNVLAVEVHQANVTSSDISFNLELVAWTSSSKLISTGDSRSTSYAANVPAHSPAFLNLLVDDRAVLYLNGLEILRYNMPGGTIGSTTLASKSLTAPAEAAFTRFPIHPAKIVKGKNVFAVEVYQANVASSDVSFDLDLVVLTP